MYAHMQVAWNTIRKALRTSGSDLALSAIQSFDETLHQGFD